MVDNSMVESIAASLIREYLSRKGLKATLRAMDEEMPRTEQSISNRVALMKQLHIEKLMKRNKQVENPLRSMVEVLTKFILEEWGLCSAIIAKSNSLSKSPQKPSDKNGSALKPSTPTEDQMVLEDTNEGETVAGRGSSTIHFSSCLDQEEIQTKRNHHPSKHRGQSCHIIGTHSLSKNISRTNGTKLKASIESYLDSSNPLGDLSVEQSAVPIASESPLSTFLFDEYSDGQGKKSDFIMDYFHPQNGKSDDPLSPPVSTSSSRSSSAVVSTELDRAMTSSSQRSLTSTVKDQIKDLFTSESYCIDECSMFNEQPLRPIMKRSSSVEAQKIGELEDVDDLEAAPLDMSALKSTIPSAMSAVTTPINLKTAMKLKILILGSANSQFNPEWFRQNLEFSNVPLLQYGIVQKKGGPCGVLAAIQAYVLLEMLFGENKLTSSKNLEPSPEDCRNALAAALSRIFWNAGDQKTATVALSSGTSHFIGGNQCKPDRLVETLMLYKFSSFTDLNAFVKKNIILFEAEGSSGVLLALYSTVLSRTVEKIRNEMDEPNGKLLGAYSYCSQEMVNLFMTGQAVSNVFNDKMELNGGTGIVTVLKGIPHRSNIGFLSLFEHYGNCQVGSYYKTPKYPIWIVCSESHFSVLFSMKQDLISDWRAERRFDLYYYDGLARQQDPIRLTIDTTRSEFKAPSDDDLVPPLDKCIRTKWPDAHVDWNSTEPLL